MWCNYVQKHFPGWVETIMTHAIVCKGKPCRTPRPYSVPQDCGGLNMPLWGGRSQRRSVLLLSCLGWIFALFLIWRWEVHDGLQGVKDSNLMLSGWVNTHLCKKRVEELSKLWCDVSKNNITLYQHCTRSSKSQQKGIRAPPFWGKFMVYPQAIRHLTWLLIEAFCERFPKETVS